MVLPTTRYARAGDLHIAYQVHGSGPRDIVMAGGPASNLELAWDDPGSARALERLGTFARVIRFDRRGTGLSDPLPGAAILEDQMEDVRAVMDAAESERAVLIGSSEASRMAALFAGTHPDRTDALVLIAASAAGSKVMTPAVIESFRNAFTSDWGGRAMLELFAPSRSDDEAYARWFGRLVRMGASPGTAEKIMRMSVESDVTQVLSAIRVPTLVLHRRDDRLTPLALGRQVAEAIPEARFVEFEGADHMPWVGEAAHDLLDEIEEFLTGARPVRVPDRALATIMFTDIVESTKRAAEVGDSRWRSLLSEHDALIRRLLTEYRGREIKTVGDGFLATFDGPARAVRCAYAAARRAPELGLELRVGLHTGECDLIGDDVGGLAVHLAARVIACAGVGEVLASSTVRDLVVGSGIDFADRGAHSLKGVPGEWRLYSVRAT